MAQQEVPRWYQRCLEKSKGFLEKKMGFLENKIGFLEKTKIGSRKDQRVSRKVLEKTNSSETLTKTQTRPAGKNRVSRKD